MEVKYHQHIGIYKNAISHQLCDKLIQHYDNSKLIFLRENKNQFHPGDRPRDNYTFLNLLLNLDKYSTKEKQEIKNDINSFYKILFKLVSNYIYKYPHLEEYGKLIPCEGIKVQKTLPGEGYHMFHMEQDATRVEYMARILVYSLYLNDIEKGGETEFLHQHIRLKPKKGTLCIFPAGFTHVHRGNPPLLGEKYITTGWLCSESILNFGN